jgi:hypothetical protein
MDDGIRIGHCACVGFVSAEAAFLTFVASCWIANPAARAGRFRAADSIIARNAQDTPISIIALSIIRLKAGILRILSRARHVSTESVDKSVEKLRGSGCNARRA